MSASAKKRPMAKGMDRTGIPHTAETRARISMVQKGRPPFFKGRHHSEKTREILRAKTLKQIREGKSALWKGGVSKVPGYNRVRYRVYIAKRNGNGGSFTVAEWETLKAQYDWTCPHCGRYEPIIKLTIDHIIPVSRGGSSNIENIQPLCQSCNSKKKDKIL